jgi:hypothetical protein
MKPHEMIFKRLALTGTCSILLCLAAGCASSRIENRPQGAATAVSLSGKNYRLIQGGAKGESYGFRLLGLIPFASPHYADAKRALYASVHEPLTNKAVALANEMEDKSTVYLILFSIPQLSITADVIEFTDNPGTK